jgi:hypothetical protein
MYRSNLACNLQQPDMNNGVGGKPSLMSLSKSLLDTVHPSCMLLFLFAC